MKQSLINYYEFKNLIYNNYVDKSKKQDNFDKIIKSNMDTANVIVCDYNMFDRIYKLQSEDMTQNLCYPVSPIYVTFNQPVNGIAGILMCHEFISIMSIENGKRIITIAKLYDDWSPEMDDEIINFVKITGILCYSVRVKFVTKQADKTLLKMNKMLDKTHVNIKPLTSYYELTTVLKESRYVSIIDNFKMLRTVANTNKNIISRSELDELKLFNIDIKSYVEFCDKQSLVKSINHLLNIDVKDGFVTNKPEYLDLGKIDRPFEYMYINFKSPHRRLPWKVADPPASRVLRLKIYPDT